MVRPEELSLASIGELCLIDGMASSGHPRGCSVTESRASALVRRFEIQSARLRELDPKRLQGFVASQSR